ncbi:MAG: hypothetical protein U9N56_08320 [Actinomycetota bacterium]|nr:hypothetical protein [Actinomycetota bacterium]
MKSRSLLVLVLALGLVAAACDSSEAELSTTSSLVTGTTETPDQGTTTTGAPASTSTTPLVGETVTSYEVVVRIAGDNGEILYIVVPEGAYTDVDLENFIGDLKEADPDLWGAEVFDDEDAVEAFVIPADQRTDEQQQLLDEHHFVSLIGGDTMKFQGPFSDFGEFIIGS